MVEVEASAACIVLDTQFVGDRCNNCPIGANNWEQTCNYFVPSSLQQLTVNAEGFMPSNPKCALDYRKF